MSFNSGVNTGALKDKSSAIVGTASITLLAANPGRRFLIIQNVSAVNIGINPFGGAAVIGGAGTFTLVPAGSWVFENNEICTGAFTVIAASGSNNVVSCAEA